MKPIVVKWGIGAVVLAGVLVVAGVRLSGGTAVQVVTVERRAIQQSVVVTGRVNAPARIDVGAEVTATVAEVRVREGDRVAAGALLLRLSDAEALATLEQARGALAEARLRVRQQSGVSRPVADQAVRQAEVVATNAERELQRARDLVAQGFYSQQKLDEAQRIHDTARSALDSARLLAEAQQARGVEPVLAASRVEQAEATLAAAQARLARLRITSPMDAVVLTRQVEPGSLAQPGKILLSLAAARGVRIDAHVDEKHLRVLTPGMPGRVLADAVPAEPFDARLSYVAPAVDPLRGSVEVRLEVPAPPAFLRPDMTVSVELLGGSRPDALVLPAAAVRDSDRDAPWVLLLREGRAVRVPVRVGLTGVGAIEVTDGLAAGDTAIPQTEKALPGDRVRAAAPRGGEKGMEVPSFISR